jgi:hypothetical protein
MSLVTHFRRRLPAHGADDGELVDRGQRHHRGEEIRRVRADRVGDRHRLLARGGF